MTAEEEAVRAAVTELVRAVKAHLGEEGPWLHLDWDIGPGTFFIDGWVQ